MKSQKGLNTSFLLAFEKKITIFNTTLQYFPKKLKSAMNFSFCKNM
jgi:hypothetical protein